jgi:AbrB family looped-hinge helix DNA binding protein
MPTSRVTRKGQITIPQAIRTELGIQEGDTVQVTLEEGLVVVRRLERWQDLAGSLAHLARRVPAGEDELEEEAEQAWLDGTAGG